MRQRNHCSSLKGTPKMKLQGSGPSAPKSLQSQNRPRPENRLSISRLDVVHGQRLIPPREPSKQLNAKSLPATKRRAASGLRLSAHAEPSASTIKNTIANRV